MHYHIRKIVATKITKVQCQQLFLYTTVQCMYMYNTDAIKCKMLSLNKHCNASDEYL